MSQRYMVVYAYLGKGKILDKDSIFSYGYSFSKNDKHNAIMSVARDRAKKAEGTLMAVWKIEWKNPKDTYKHVWSNGGFPKEKLAAPVGDFAKNYRAASHIEEEPKKPKPRLSVVSGGKPRYRAHADAQEPKAEKFKLFVTSPAELSPEKVE